MRWKWLLYMSYLQVGGAGANFLDQSSRAEWINKKISRAQQETRMKKRKTKRTEKGHRWTMCLFAMLWLCFAGYCFASAPQGHPGYFEGNGIGEVSNSTLVAFQTYCCPTGTQGSRSRSIMAGSSHAGCWMAEQLLQQRFCIAQQDLGVSLRSHINLPTLGSGVTCVLWLLFGNPNRLFWKQRRRRSTTDVSIRCRSERVSGRWAGICRWIGKRRYKVLKSKYRFLGKKKRILLLHSLQKARFQSTRSLRKTDCLNDGNSIRNQWWYKLGVKTFGKGTWKFLRNWFADLSACVDPSRKFKVVL